MTLLEYSAVELRTSPHVKSPLSTVSIMRNVVWALLPVWAYAAYTFGVSVLLLVSATTLACVLTERLVCLASRRDNTTGDWSAVITGMLLGLTLPPGFPLWMGFLGGVVSILLGKAIFGGLGHNAFNPALVGRAFLQAAFPVAITNWTPPGLSWAKIIPTTLTLPFMHPDWEGLKAWVKTALAANTDGWSGATPLMIMKSAMKSDAHLTDSAYQALSTWDMFTGWIGGSAGETSAIIILLCGAYLAARRMLNWQIPVAMLASVFIVSGLFWLSNREVYPSPVFMMCSGGLMLGAVFMATDMVTSPATPKGLWLFGVLTGFLTVMIRLFGALPEGVMYAILLSNAFTPIINNLTQARIYGYRKAAPKS